MSETPDEIVVDLDEIDRQIAADKAAKEAARAEKAVKKAAPEKVDVVKADEAKKPPEKPVVTPEDGIAKLQQQLDAEKKRADDEQAAREAAERREQEAKKEAAAAKNDSQDNQLHLVTTAIEKVTQSNDILESKYAEALAAQDYAGASKINREMQTNSAQLIQLEAGKKMLEQRAKAPPPESTDVVEDFCSRLTPKSADWVRAHPDYVRNPDKNQEMLAAHNLVTARKIKADTPTYFQEIEKILGLTKAAPPADDVITVDDTALSDAARPTRSTAPAGAPVSRSGNGSGGRPNQVTLTPEQAEIAYLNFPDSKTPLEDYARQLQAIAREKLNS
jgi:hypothetical protein